MKLAVIPAAGLSSRLGGAVKELLPIRRFDNGPPLTALQNTFRTAALCCDEAVVIVSTAKAAVLMEAVAQSDLGLPVSFVHQAQAKGLGAAVEAAAHMIERSNASLLLMPDTLLLPATGPQEAMNQLLVDDNQIAVTTLHQVDHPEKFGAAVFQDEELVGYQDKHTPPPSTWVWTSVAFRPAFLPYIREASEPGREIGMTEAIHKATWAGVASAVKQQNGSYIDIGTPDGLLTALNKI